MNMSMTTQREIMNTIAADMQQESTPTNNSNKRTRRRKSTQNQQKNTGATTPQSGSIPGLESSEVEPGGKAADKAPRSKGSFRVAKKRVDLLAENIAATYATAGIFIAARDQYDGLLIIATSTDRANELAVALSHNKGLFELAERVFKQGDVMKCVIGHGMTLYAIMAHHKRAPVNHMLLQQFGFLPEQIYAKFNQAVPSEPEPAGPYPYREDNTGTTTGLS